MHASMLLLRLQLYHSTHQSFMVKEKIFGVLPCHFLQLGQQSSLTPFAEACRKLGKDTHEIPSSWEKLFDGT